MKNVNFRINTRLNGIVMPTKPVKKGIVYTPDYIVKNMLDLLEYSGAKIIDKHIIDNSCGEGAFLIEVVDRYITECYNIHLDQKQIVKNLSIFIHGIELDLVAYEKCIINLNNLLIKRNINLKVNWDIVFGDSLKEEKYDNKMDYVVGNPPYIRIHDLESINYKKFAFANKGMTDLFIIFYEISLKMLNSNGKLIYITPNSYFTSTAGEKLRHFIYSNKKINTIVNLKHFNPFENVTTYTTITLLNNSLNNSIYYFEYDKNKKIPKKIAKLNYSDFYINKQFYFSTKNSLNKFRKIMLTEFNRDIHIKNGVSSNLDSFFLIKIIMVNILLMQ